MHDSVQDCFSGSSIFRHQVIPVLYRHLTYEDSGMPAVSVFDKLQEVQHLLGIESSESEVVYNKQIGCTCFVKASW